MESVGILPRLITAVGALLLFQASPADTHRLPDEDRVRLAEAFRLGDQIGDQVWRGWKKAPFGVLLITADFEFLVRHPKPSADFVNLGRDPLLKSIVYARKRQLPLNLQATYPAVGGIPTIVIGQAESTQSKTSTPWVITVLHEHFHQLQTSRPDYYPGVNRLNLSGGDQSGMWMLNYPFPYDSDPVKSRFKNLARRLAEAIEEEDTARFKSRVEAYLAARSEFAGALKPEDYRYFAFQLWNEGLARYTEIRVAERAAKLYKPTSAFVHLQDFEPFKVSADAVRERTLRELKTLTLDGFKRVAFYSLGAGEGLLLDRIHSDWQGRYFAEKFDPAIYFQDRK